MCHLMVYRVLKKSHLKWWTDLTWPAFSVVAPLGIWGIKYGIEEIGFVMGILYGLG